MNPPDRIEVATALYGAWRLIRGDAGGLTYFKSGRDGFWSAAWAVGLILPAHLLTIAVHVAGRPMGSFGLSDLVREALILMVGWFGYALLGFYVLRGVGKLGRFDSYMTAYYWTTVPLAYAETVLTLLRAAGLLPSPIESLLAIGFLMLVLWARWFVARTGLAVKGGEAAAVVIGTLMFDIIIGKVLSPLL